jgi:heme exporter protein B
MNARSLRVIAAVVSRDLLVVARQQRVRFASMTLIAAVVLIAWAGLHMDGTATWRLLPPLLWSFAVAVGVLAYAMLLDADTLDGSLDQMLLAGHSRRVVVAAKACSHWLLSGFPTLLLLAAIVAAGMGVPGATLRALLLCLLVGSAAQSIAGAAVVVAAATRAGIDGRVYQRRLLACLAGMACAVAVVASVRTVPALVFGFAVLGAAYTIMLHLASRIAARA